MFGFLFFARDILNDSAHDLSFVPFLFNNSSTIESTFSVLRRTNRDTALSIEKGLLAGNLKKAHTISSKSHSGKDSMQENPTLFDSDHDFLAGPKERERWFDQLLRKRQENAAGRQQPPEGKRVATFPPHARGSKLERWRSIAMGSEDGPSFSAVLVKNKSFRDWAEASMHCEETKRWFEKIICCESEEDDAFFDGLCQRINWKLVTMLLEAWEEEKSFFGKLIAMLQDKDVHGLLPVGTSLNERMGFVSLILVLVEEIERRQRSGVVALAENIRRKKMGDKLLNKKDVNKLFGWAIHSVRQKKQKESFKVKENGGDRTQLEKEIQFLKSMIFRKSQALLNEEHCQNHYDSFLRSYDKGGLTLVNPKHFDFGLRVLEWVSEAVTTEKLESTMGVTKQAKDKLLVDKNLIDDFLEVTKDHKELDEEGKLKVLKELLAKLANVKFHDVVSQIGRKKTGRGGKEITRADLTTRDHRSNVTREEDRTNTRE